MTKELRDFMWQHSKAFKEKDIDWDMIFKDAHEDLDEEVVVEFVNLLSNTRNVNIDLVKRTCVLKELLAQIQYALDNPGVMQDSSNGWSRFDSAWMSLQTYDLDAKEFLEFLKKSGHQYGLNLTQLEFPYGYWGDGSDWDLGWFNREEYDRLYSDEEDYEGLNERFHI